MSQRGRGARAVLFAGSRPIIPGEKASRGCRLLLPRHREIPASPPKNWKGASLTNKGGKERMNNDEGPVTQPKARPGFQRNDEARMTSLNIRHWELIRHSSFGNSSFTLR